MIDRDNWKLTKAYLQYRAEVSHLAGDSIKLERRCLRHLLEWADSRPFHRAPSIRPRFPDYVLGARRDGRDKPLSREYLRKTISTARRFLGWLAVHRTGYRSSFAVWLDTLVVPKLDQTSKEHEAVTLDEVRAMAIAPTETARERRVQAAAVFWFLSGIRVGAFVTLPVAAIDLGALQVRQWPSLGVHTKFGKHATTHLLDIEDLLNVVRAWDGEVRSVLPGSGYWFAPLLPETDSIDPSADTVGEHRADRARKDLRDWLRRVGLPYHSPHKFRHGNAVYSLKRCRDLADLKAVSQNLMHSNISTTDGIYAVLSQDDLAERIRGLARSETSRASLDYGRLAREIVALTQTQDSL